MFFIYICAHSTRVTLTLCSIAIQYTLRVSGGIPSKDARRSY